MRHFKTTPTSAFIFYRSYSRWNGKARESWMVMVDRCVTGLAELGKLTEYEKWLLSDEFDNSTALPSGRYMWCGGTDWGDVQANYPGMYNCFQGDTLVNTLEFGSVPIKELIGKQVNVVNKNREWVPVEFNEYGTQSLYEITMRRGVSSGAVKTIRATADHLWHLESGETYTTANLRSGFYIPFVTANRPVIKDESVYTLGIRHGIIYGDGSYRDSSSWGRVNFKVRLCGEKSELLQYFDDCNVCYPPSYNGDPVANVKGRDYIDYVPSINLKDLPETDDLDYLLGFFRGLLATDGSVNSGEKSAVCVNISGKLETLLWVETLAPRLGIENGTMRCLYEAGTESNFGSRKTSTYQSLFYPGSITKEDLLRSKHKEKFGDGMKQPSLWRVLDVQDIDMSETVYCCEEPITNTFVLTGGILTGNCSSTVVDSIETFGYLMDLAMTGCGTGAVLELENIAKLPPIKTKLNIELVDEIGTAPSDNREQETRSRIYGDTIELVVGDSRRGWVESYVGLIQLAVSDIPGGELTVRVHLSNVRPAGERLSGFGGTANPSKLPELYGKVVAILNGAIGRQLNSIECCKLIDEAAIVIVAGNIRRSAGIRQFSADDQLALTAKDNLWQQGEDGKWQIDPERDALRMSNHTRVFHTKPTLEECIDSVRKQYYSGEGAIQWAGEAVARANADLLDTPDKKAVFLGLYNGDRELAKDWLDKLGLGTEDNNILHHRMVRYGGNPCALGSMELLTVDGYRTFESLDGQDVNIINASGQVSKSKVWFSGIKETIEITFEGRSKPLICTPDHQLMDVNGNTVLAGESKGRRLMPFTAPPTHDPLYVAYGIVQGDGVLGDLRNPDKGGVNLCVGDRDTDFINILDNAGLAYTVSKNLKNVYINNGFADQLKALGFSDKILPERELPSTFADWTIEQKKAFLNGVFTANGCIHSSAKGRISLKGTCKAFIDSIQSLLAELNIQSYVTVNKPKVNKFYNGEYTMKQSYDLNIQQYFSRSEFSRLIGFSLDYKSDLLAEKLIETAPKVRLIRPYGKHKVYDFTEPLTHWGIVNTTVFHNCFEVVGSDFMCNLAEVHLNTINPFDFDAQVSAFKAASLSVSALLHHEFEIPRYQKSRELDPIVGVSFTGLFDFFVHLFGIEWLKWWQYGRPQFWGPPTDVRCDSRLRELVEADFIRAFHFDSLSQMFLAIEEEYLCSWKAIVFDTIAEYCERHGLKIPNRSTLVQPGGSKSLLTGASSGWAPPKASRYIRRMTFGKNEPLALAAIDMGYSVIPSQSDKDENGNLLNDIHDPRVTEWLVEIPCATSWANMPGVDEIDISQFSALAQFDFYMQVQRYYSTHTTSATIEMREHEIEPLATAIYEDIQNDGGYMSAALLARFDSLETFPRMPFEPIGKDEYDDAIVAIRMRRVESDFDVALAKHDRGQTAESGPSGCDSEACTLPERKAN